MIKKYFSMKSIMLFSFSTILILNMSCESSTSSRAELPMFMDYKFGMSRVEFFELSKEYNKQGLVTQGSKNTSVAYIDTTTYRSQVEVNYYPTFDDEDKLETMPVHYNYSFWAPWNKELRADSLVVELVEKIQTDNELIFDKQKDKNLRDIYVYKEGPFEIKVINEDDYYVLVEYRYKKN